MSSTLDEHPDADQRRRCEQDDRDDGEHRYPEATLTEQGQESRDQSEHPGRRVGDIYPRRGVSDCGVGPEAEVERSADDGGECQHLDHHRAENWFAIVRVIRGGDEQPHAQAEDHGLDPGRPLRQVGGEKCPDHS